jgi:hypothetical protein
LSSGAYVEYNVSGYEYVKFLGIKVRNSSLSNGYAFGHYSAGEWVDDFHSAYTIDSSLSANSVQSEYYLRIPNGATHFRTNCTTGAFSIDDFYCYLEVRESFEKLVSIPKDNKVPVTLIMGKLYNGVIATGYNSVDSFQSNLQNRMILPYFIRFDKNDEIVSIDGINNGETLEVFAYDKGLNYLGVYNNQEDVAYIRLMVTNSSVYTHKNKLLELTISSNHTVSYAKEPLKTVNGEIKPRFFAYEIDNTINPADVSETLSYVGPGQRDWNHGYLYFSKNYSPIGKPSKFALFLHGSDGYTFTETSVTPYEEQIKFLTENGYCVADCYAFGGRYYAGSNATNMNWAIPQYIQAITSLYKRIVEGFNVEREVYVFSKSAGGLLATLLATKSPFPIRCIGMLAPTVENVAQMLGTSKNGNNLLLSVVGCENPNVSAFLGSSYNDMTPAADGDKNYVLANLGKIMKYDPFFAGCSGLTDAKYYNFANEILSTGRNTENLAQNSSLVDMVGGFAKTTKVPIKIWIAKDDEAVAFVMCQWMKEMIDRAGGVCYLREFPQNCGGHHAVDNSPLAPQTSFVTNLGVSYNNIVVAYAELVDWFNLW